MRSHAIVTGGSSGIGLALGERLVERGCNLSLLARDPAGLESARSHLESAELGSDQVVEIHPTDVSQAEQAESSVGTAIERLGPPNILVTSAGVAQPGYFNDLPLETFESTMAVNFFGTLHVVRCVVPAMLANGGGKIVMISSGAGLIGVFGYTAYSASKFAVRGFAEALRAELSPKGINVSVVFPPDTDTPQLTAETASKPRETRAITAKATVLTPAAVADSIVRGMDRGRFCIYPGWSMRALGYFHSLLGSFLHRHFDRLAARSLRE